MTEDMQRQFLYGDVQELPTRHHLNAGPVNVVYEKGALRYIRIGKTEVVRMIYSAVRDHNWDTVHPLVTEEHIENNAGAFIIKLTCEYNSGPIQYVAKYIIAGTEEGTIAFEMFGKALSDFSKNRIGFCVLHPIGECAGKPCDITDPTGHVSRLYFPELISPHRPFTNISSMSWPVKADLNAFLSFKGDVFETEDQRNWTDASFKTYCTPLEEPFPVNVAEGQTFRQSVELRFEGVLKDSENADCLCRVQIDHKSLIPLPELGVCRSSEVSELSALALANLRELNPAHYRIDIRMNEEHWPLFLQKSASEAKAINTSLFIVLHLVDEQSKLDSLIWLLKTLEVKIAHFLVLKMGAKVTPSDMIIAVVPALRTNFPNAKIGAGTDAYFAELNRNPVNAELLDFVSFSVNPQVHAFDNTSLIETLEAQKEVVRSAKAQYPGMSIYVSPVTFNPRFNPNATAPYDGSLQERADVRQTSLFGAGWMLGSIKNLAEAGTGCITYFESIGRKGFSMLGNPEDATHVSPVLRGRDFPIKFVMKKLRASRGIHGIRIWKPSHPLLFSSLVLVADTADIVLLSNHTEGELPIHLGDLGAEVYFKQLDVYGICMTNWLETFSKMDSERISSQDITVVIKPQALAVLTVPR